MNLLEQIIRKTLFESRTVAKIRNATANMTAAARKAGAVHAYAVLVKGTSNETDIESLIEAATNASVGGSETEMAVGKTSKFANGEYTYVCSELESKKRQLINIWIMPNAIIEAMPDREGTTKDKIKQARGGFTKIGNSTMLTKTQLSGFKDLDFVDTLKTLKGGVLNPAIPGDEETDDNVDNKTDDTVNNKPVTKNERTEWLSKNQTKNVTFPYTWYTYNTDNTTLETTVYKATILDNKEYLYTYLKDLNAWLVMKDPEKFIPTIEKQQSDPNFSASTWGKLWDTLDPNPEEKKKLDALQGILTPDRAIVYPYKWNTNNGELTIYTTGPTDEYVYWIQDNKWHTFKKFKFESALKDGSDIAGVIITKPLVVASLNKTFNQRVGAEKPEVPVKTYKKNESIKLNSTNVYEYKNNKFVEMGYYKSDTTKITYQGISTDKKYTYVQFGSGQKYWVLTSSIKK